MTDVFAGGGEMGALMRSIDWSKTRLGPVEYWPSSLRTMLGVVLGSRFPMLLWWGPELLHLYNDAYRPILRDKHPASLAAPAAEVWAEVWDVAGPMARGVQEGGPATWTEDLQLFIKSGEMAEETYFTFSYSPVPGDDGGVAGLLNTVQETTAKVYSERLIRMLRDLGARAGAAKSEDAVYPIVAQVLEENALDLPFVLLYALNDDCGEARLVASSGLSGYAGAAKPELVSIDAETAPTDWPFREVVHTAGKVVVDDLTARFGPLPLGRWNARPQRAIVLPLNRAGRSTPYALLACGISPHRALDERYAGLFQATLDQVANVVANARAFEAEKVRAEGLAEIDRVKTTFFSNVSHEFRTPLTLILGPLEQALSGHGVLAGETLQAVHHSALRLLRLVNSLLDFSRTEAGRQHVAFEPIDLAMLTAGLAGSFQSLIEDAGMKLHVDCPALPQAVYVDRAQWEKIVLNLLSNAFKFTFEGEIGVSLRWHDDHVELGVRDTGTGIPAPELPRIFERFHRVEGARGRSFEGTGIGLALVQELVKLHGGAVTASSVEGQGTTFVVTIPTGFAHLPQDRVVESGQPGLRPQVDAYFLEAASWEASSLSGAAAPDVEPGLARDPETHILVADDNADMRRYLVRLLEPHWTVQAVPDGQVALASAQARAPDLILSDVMMPVMDGVALLRALRADEKTSGIPVILLSARAGQEAILGGLETGADDYLVKPFSALELLSRVKTHLQLKRIRQSTHAQLLQSAKMASLGELVAGVAHEINNPLAFALSHVDTVSRTLEQFEARVGAGIPDSERPHWDRARNRLREVQSGLERIRELVVKLRTFSRLDEGELKLVSMRESVEAVLTILGHRLRKEIDVVTHFGEPDLVSCYAGLLNQAIMNIVANAIDAIAGSGTISISTGLEGSTYLIRVSDSGSGIPEAIRDRVFEPFFTTKAVGHGTGLGLSITYSIVKKHRGDLELRPRPEGGTTATIRFPLQRLSSPP